MRWRNLLQALMCIFVAACANLGPKFEHAPLTGIWNVVLHYRNGTTANGEMILSIDKSGVFGGTATKLTPRGDWHFQLSSESIAPSDRRVTALGDATLLRLTPQSRCVDKGGDRASEIGVFADGEPAGELCLQSDGYDLNISGSVFGVQLTSGVGNRPVFPAFGFFRAHSFSTDNVLGSTIYTMFGGVLAIIAAFLLSLAVTHVRLAGSIVWHRIHFFVPDAEVRSEQLGSMRLFCQIVRFGSDQYFEKMASPLERQHGRLLNRVIKGKIAKEGNDWSLEFRLPVHKRLGTQFVMLLEGDEARIARLAETPFFKDAERGGHPSGHQLYFRISKSDRRDCAIFENVEKIRNNMFFPSNIPDFTSKNRFRRWV